MLFQGIIVKKMPMQTGMSQRGNQWSKQTYVLEYDTNQQYPKQIAFDLMNDKIASYNLQEGEFISAEIDFTVNEYNGRMFNNVNCWKVTKPTAQNPVVRQSDSVAPPPQAAPMAQPQQEEPVEELPF